MADRGELARFYCVMADTEQLVRYGCVRFDCTREHSRGWAAIAGEKPFRIASTRDLSSEVVWLHNLDYEMTFAAGMEHHAGFRRNEYLSEHFLKTTAITEQRWRNDLVSALANPENDSAAQVKRMALVFDRVMQLSASLLALQDPPFRQLLTGVRELAMGYDPIVPKIIADAMADSCTPWINTERETLYQNQQPQLIRLSLPKSQHAMACIHPVMPAGDWIALGLPGQGAGAIDSWLQEAGPYCLVNVAIEKMESDAYRLINFGSGRRVRRWVTGKELAFIKDFGKIKIKAAYKPSQLEPLPFIETLKSQCNPFHDLSVSANLFWQNVWLGLCAKLPPPPHIRKGRPTANVLEPFIRAEDRNRCLVAALRVHREGGTVLGYGRGRLLVEHDGNDEGLATIARKAGLIPQFLQCGVNDAVQTDTAIQVYQEIHIQGDYDQLNDADTQIMELIKNGQRR